MAATGIIGCRGLHTDPSAVSPPPGGMRTCDEVIIDAAGVATCRPSFEPFADKANESPAHWSPLCLAAYGDEVIAVSRDVDSGSWRIDTASTVLAGDPTPPLWPDAGTAFAQTRRRLYLTTASGVQVLSAPEAAGIERAGAPQPPQGRVQGYPGGWLADGESVAYRWTLARRWPDGFEARSAPSSWYEYRNTSGGTEYTDVTIVLPPGLSGDGWAVELWRSQTVSSGIPSDVLYLVGRLPLTPTDVENGFVVTSDVTDEQDLREVLYTSSTREGIEGGNLPPPHAVALAEWQGSLWAGAITEPHTLVMDVRDVTDWLFLQPNVSSTANSPVIGLPLGDVLPGQRVRLLGAALPSGELITTIKALGPGVGEVTLDDDVPVTASDLYAIVSEVVTIDGVALYAAQATGGGAFAVPTAGVARELRAARELAIAITEESGGALWAQAVEDSLEQYDDRRVRIIVRRTDPTDTTPIAFGLQHTDTLIAPFNTSSQDARPNRVAFSKPLEPEHFRALDWIELGREDAHVLALVPLAESLLVFKQDGVWSIHGTWPLFSASRIDEARLLHGDLVDAIDGRAIARTDRGVVAYTGSGPVARLTEGRIEEELRGQYHRHQSWLRAWPELDIVLMSVGSTNGIAPDAVYCLHLGTGEWSRWTIPATSLVRHPARRVAFAGWGTLDRWELRQSVEPRGYDAQYTIDTWSISGAEITVAVADAAGWVPRPGHVVRALGVVPDGEQLRLVDVSATVVDVLDAGGSYSITTDAEWPPYANGVRLHAYESVIATLEWQRHGVSQPSIGGHIREVQVHIDQSDAASSPVPTARVEAGGTADREPTRYTLVAQPRLDEVHSRPVRLGLSRQLGRTTHLYPWVRLTGLYRWRVLGVALVGNAISTRVRR